MPLALPFVAILLVLTAPVLYVLLERTDAWLRSLLVWIFKPRRSFWKRVAMLPVKAIAGSVQKVEHGVSSAMSWVVGHTIKPITAEFHALAVGTREAWIEVGYLAQQTQAALFYLRHTAIPTLINRAVAPVRTLAQQANTLARQTAASFNRAEMQLLNALSAAGIGAWATMGNGLAGFVKYADSLHDEVWKNIRPKLLQLIAVEIPDLWRSIGLVTEDLYHTGIDSLNGIRNRLRSLEDALGTAIGGLSDTVLAILATAAGVAAIEAILTRLAPNLFCRNTKAVTSKLCGLDESLIDDLLAGILLAAVVIDAEEMARAAQDLAGGMTGIIREVAKI